MNIQFFGPFLSGSGCLRRTKVVGTRQHSEEWVA